MAGVHHSTLPKSLSLFCRRTFVPRTFAATALFVAAVIGSLPAVAARNDGVAATITPPVPVPAQRPAKSAAPKTAAPGAVFSPAAAEAARLLRINAAKSWGYQLEGIKLDDLARSPYDLLVVDATTGLAAGRPFRPDEVAALQRKPDGSARLVVSYLSVGEAEDYRPEYFDPEYMKEDAPDWLLHENKDWKGNRLVKFCADGWQKTILGDDHGKSVYGGDESAPLYRLIDLGFDGVYLDRVDVYEEVAKQCPGAEQRMIDFVVRLAEHARKRNSNFMVILQNAEDLLRHPRMVKALDAVAKESLFHGWGGGDGSNGKSVSSADDIAWSTQRLNFARNAGRPVFVVDYCADRARADLSVRRIREQGYIPYIAKKSLDTLYLPGRDF